ncbi:MAG: sodium-translocating pyrophosphatase [Chloroflexota bacterium]
METILNSIVAQEAAGSGSVPVLFWLGLIGAISALVTAYFLYNSILEESEGTEAMIEIAEAIREGAMAYLSAQYRYIAYVFGGLFIVFLILSALGAQQWQVVFAFITAGLASGSAGYIGMRTATQASARTANAASRSLDEGLQIAFRGGAVMGMSVVGMALLDMSIWFMILRFGFSLEPLAISSTMLSAAVGASTVALFGRVGGGIYTKAADVGADLVGKVEAGIPEDDPRNPATIADNVGDNVGDVAGMGADLYESYLASILSAGALGVAGAVAVSAGIDAQLKYLAAPVMLAGVGALVSIGSIFTVRAKEDSTMKDLMFSLESAIWIASAVIAAVSYILLDILGGSSGFANHNTAQIWFALLVGLVAGILIGRITEYYTSSEYAPTKLIAEQSDTGPGTVIISGLAVGMESTGLPVIVVVFATAFAFFVGGGSESTLAGLFGVGIAAVGMLSTLGVSLATDAYGPIADNAGGNAEMAGLDPTVRERTDQLDALGNTTAATGKGFAIGSAALTGLALLATYVQQVNTNLAGFGVTDINGVALDGTLESFIDAFNINPINPFFLLGMFLGAMVAFYFGALTMSAVGRAANEMVVEVRRQFREIPGIMEGTAKPDYKTCVEISTTSALREMVIPSLLAIVVPIVVGVLMGVAGVMGLLSGGLATAFSLAIMMSNAGGAWDNAKKYVESGEFKDRNGEVQAKGSENHKATVVGDTVGDPFKDTSGPSLNILIKLMSIVSVVFAGAVALVGNGQGLILALIGG